MAYVLEFLSQDSIDQNVEFDQIEIVMEDDNFRLRGHEMLL